MAQWPFRTLENMAASLLLELTIQFVSVDPFTTIYAAVTRRDDEGKLTSTNRGKKFPWQIH